MPETPDQQPPYDTPKSFDEFKQSFLTEIDDMIARGKSPEELAEIIVDDLEVVYPDYYELDYIVAKAKDELWTPDELEGRCMNLRDKLTVARKRKAGAEHAFYRYLISKLQMPMFELEEVTDKLRNRELNDIQETIWNEFKGGTLNPAQTIPLNFQYTPAEAALFGGQVEGIAYYPNTPLGIVGGATPERINDLRSIQTIPFPYGPKDSTDEPVFIDVQLLPLTEDMVHSEQVVPTYRIIGAYVGNKHDPGHSRPVPQKAENYFKGKARRRQLDARKALAAKLE